MLYTRTLTAGGTVELSKRRAAQRRAIREISSSDDFEAEESSDMMMDDDGPCYRGPGMPKVTAGVFCLWLLCLMRVCVYVCVKGDACKIQCSVLVSGYFRNEH